MTCVALISNPNSTGNKSMLPEVRSFCASNDHVFHYEVDHVEQIADALRTIARVRPKVIVVNGGDGTVQAALTELYQGNHFPEGPPPVAVLPNGKTNLIALDLGAQGNPLEALEKIIEIAQSDMSRHLVARELIALSDGRPDGREVLGMFLGGAGLSEFILYCRHKIYPLGLPNALSHVLTMLAALLSVLFGLKAAFLPARPQPLRISMIQEGQLQGSFAVLIVTTLEKLLLMGSSDHNAATSGKMRFLAIDSAPRTVLRFLWAVYRGKLGAEQGKGIHMERGQLIRIEGDNNNVLLDGELFRSEAGGSITLRSTEPVNFLRLAA